MPTTYKLPLAYRVALSSIPGASCLFLMPWCLIVTTNALIAFVGSTVLGAAITAFNLYAMSLVTLVIHPERIIFTNLAYSVEASWAEVMGLGEVKGWSRPTQGLRLKSCRIRRSSSWLRFLDYQGLFYNQVPVGIALGPFALGAWQQSEVGESVRKYKPEILKG